MRDNYGVSIRTYDLVFEKELLGTRFEFWILHPGGANREFCCDTSDLSLVDSIQGKTHMGTKILRIVDNNYVTADERDVVEISTLQELKNIERKAIALSQAREKAAEGSVEVAKAFLRTLKREIGFDEHEVSPESASVRFLGGYSAWSGDDEDICDAHILSPLVEHKTEQVITKFNNTCKDFKVSCAGGGEKAWSYFAIIPKGF